MLFAAILQKTSSGYGQFFVNAGMPCLLVVPAARQSTVRLYGKGGGGMVRGDHNSVASEETNCDGSGYFGILGSLGGLRSVRPSCFPRASGEGTLGV